MLLLAADSSNVAGVDDDQVRDDVDCYLVLLQPDHDVGQRGAVELVVAHLHVLEGLQRVENAVGENVLAEAVDSVAVEEQILQVAERDDRFERKILQFVVRQVEEHQRLGEHPVPDTERVVPQIQHLQSFQLTQRLVRNHAQQVIRQIQLFQVVKVVKRVHVDLFKVVVIDRKLPQTPARRESPRFERFQFVAAQVDVEHLRGVSKGVAGQRAQPDVARVKAVDGAIFVEQIAGQLADGRVGETYAIESIICSEILKV